MANTTPTDLFAFGNRTGPTPPRIDRDVFPDSDGILQPENESPWHGKSTFADPNLAPLTGHYYKLPAGTPLPENLGLVADGKDVDAENINPPTHHTVYPTRRMSVEEFTRTFMDLPWQYEGKK